MDEVRILNLTLNLTLNPTLNHNLIPIKNYQKAIKIKRKIMIMKKNRRPEKLQIKHGGEPVKSK